MKKVIIIIILFSFFYSFSLFSQNNLCIQIVAFPVSDVSSIKKDKKIIDFVTKRNDCIIDKRGGGKYYGICCGNFVSRKSASKELKKVRKLFKGAFFRKFNLKYSKKANYFFNLKHKNALKVKKKRKKVVAKILSNIKYSDNFSTQTIEKPNFKLFTLRSYLQKLTDKDINYKLDQLNSLLFKLNSQIERNIYSPRLYFTIEGKVNKTYNVGSATSKINSDTIAALHLDWHLYDGQKKYYLQERKEIFDELSKLNLLSAKDRVLIDGVYIYMNLWMFQNLIDYYNILLEKQKKLVEIAMQRQLKGENLNYYEPIDSKNDFYNLKLNSVDIKESYLQKELIFRESIDLKTELPLYLYEPVYNELNKSLKELQQEAIRNNNELKKLQAEYKLSKSNIHLAQAKKSWKIDFSSYAGYGGSTELEGSNKDSGNGFEWSAGIRFTYPLSRSGINYEIEKRKIETEKAQLMVINKMKKLSVSITKLYNLIKKLKYKERILNQKNKLLKERLKVSFKRYISGKGSYKEYSNSLRYYVDNIQKEILNRSLLHSSILQMYILTGKEIY